MALIEPKYIQEARALYEEAHEEARRLSGELHNLIQDWKSRLDAGEVVGDIHPEVQKLHDDIDRAAADARRVAEAAAREAASFAQKFEREIEELADDPSRTQTAEAQVQEVSESVPGADGVHEDIVVPFIVGLSAPEAGTTTEASPADEPTDEPVAVGAEGAEDESSDSGEPEGVPAADSEESDSESSLPSAPEQPSGPEAQAQTEPSDEGGESAAS